jgi:hypothetical protein
LQNLVSKREQLKSVKRLKSSRNNNNIIETVHQPRIGKHSLHEKMTSDWSTLPQAGKWRSKHGTPQMDTPSTRSITGLIDGRHSSDAIDIMARMGANIDSDHMLVVIKLKARICCASNSKLQQLRRCTVDRLKD